MKEKIKKTLAAIVYAAVFGWWIFDCSRSLGKEYQPVDYNPIKYDTEIKYK